MTTDTSNAILIDLANSLLNESLFLRHDSEEKTIPFMQLISANEISTILLTVDTDPIAYAQSILLKRRKKYRHILIVHEASINDENGNRVDAIIIDAFDVSKKKGIQIAQRFSSKSTGEFRKIGNITTLGFPSLIVKLQNSNTEYSSITKPHFNTEIRNNNNNLLSIHTELHHNTPSVISKSIYNYVNEKLLSDESNTFNGLFEIKIKPTTSIQKTDLLKFLCVNAINEILASETRKHWTRKNKRPVTIICNLNQSLIYQAKGTNSKSTSFKFTNKNKNNHKLQLNKTYKKNLLNVKTKADKNSIMRLSKRNLECDNKELEHLSKQLNTVNCTHTTTYPKQFISRCTSVLLSFLGWLFLIRE